jgi:HPr kinase/phosphorylase
MPSVPSEPRATVADLVEGQPEGLNLALLAGQAGLSNAITSPRIQKPGLALTGFVRSVRPGRVQVLGKSEITFHSELPPDRRRVLFAEFCALAGTCLVITTSLTPPPELLDEAERLSVPLLQTPLGTGDAIDQIGRHLEKLLAPMIVEHGVLMDVSGLGVLILGESGIGKSECALDLVVRGHRLVADDVVEIRRVGGHLVGSGPELTRYHMEIRGLGIINIKELFGVASIRHQKYIELVMRLESWKPGRSYDRLGLDTRTYTLHGLPLTLIEMPVAPGRPLSVLIEVAVRHELLRLKGYNPARELAARLADRLAVTPEERG